MSKVVVVVVGHEIVVGRLVFVVDNVLAGSCLVFFVAMTVDGVNVDHVVVVVDKVNRFLARYSRRATTTNQPTNRALNKPAWPGPN